MSAARLQLVGATAPAPILFSPGSGLTQAEQQHLSHLLQYHPHGQAISDEVAGQLRTKGRGAPPRIGNPRGLAARLARVALERGVEDWYFCLDEAALRTIQPPQAQPAPASPAVRARALLELQNIKARYLAARLERGQ